MTWRAVTRLLACVAASVGLMWAIAPGLADHPVSTATTRGAVERTATTAIGHGYDLRAEGLRGQLTAIQRIGQTRGRPPARLVAPGYRLAPSVPAAEAGPLLRAANDEAYTAARHLADGRIATRDLARGREAHVFADNVDLASLEQSVWTQGTYGGSVRGWDRFTWTSETPIGWRVQAGRADVPLHTVEIKGREVGGTWTYHLVPRTGPAR